MTENSSQPIKKNWFFRNIIDNVWLRIILETAAFVLLLSKLIPLKWLSTDWPFLALVAIALLGLLISNYNLNGKLITEIREGKAREEEARLEHKSKSESLEKKARYGTVIPTLNSAFQELHNAMRRDPGDKTAFHEPFALFCGELEKVFTHLTGVTCHVCIKIAAFPKGEIPTHTKMGKIINNLQVRTYCRSSSLSSLRKQIDQSQYTHLISENTDFEFVVKDADICFFCHDLATLDEYKNSSFKSQAGGSSKYFPIGTPFEHKSKNWPLGYRTAIVAPIRPLVEQNKDEHTILGFLCVDCNTPNVFNEEIDKHIMIGCADGLYNPFQKLFSPSQQTKAIKSNPTSNK